jgi:hypothetical protein
MSPFFKPGVAGALSICFCVKDDGAVQIRKFNKIVMPAKAGIREFLIVTKHGTPVFTGMRTFYDFVKEGIINKNFFVLGSDPRRTFAAG